MTPVLETKIAAPLEELLREDGRPLVYRDVIVDQLPSGAVILLHPLEARWALTNDTGLWLARALDGGATLREVAARLAAQFDGADETLVLEDARAFVRQLHDANLIENSPVPPPPPKRAPKPPSLTIYVTEECNLRCKHCAVVEGKMPPTTLTLDEIKALIDQHTAAYDNPTVAFLGGEPTLRPDLFEMLEHAAARTTAVNMSTNGLLVDEAMAARLAAINMELQVSLDGADPEVHDFIRGKGTYAKTWAAIERLVAAGMGRRLTISTVLTRSVLEQVKALIARADALGIGTARFINLNKMRAAQTNWDRIAPNPKDLQAILRYLLIELPREDRMGKAAVRGSFPGYVPDAAPSGSPWCPLGKTFIVDSQGKTYNCPVLNTPEYQIGDIRQASLSDMAQGEVNRRTREQMLQRRFAIEECRTCAWRNFCQGGCQAYSSLRSGDMYVNDEFCEFRRDLYRENVLRSIG